MHIKRQDAQDARRLVVAVVLIVVVAQQRGILSPAQILLEPALTLRVDVAAATDQAEQDREEDEGVCRGPQDECDPDAEVVDFENLDC